MKSTKVQNPRRIPRIKPIIRGYGHVAVLLPGQLPLLRGLAAFACLVWGKIEPATRPSRTILYDALNGQTTSSHRSRFMPHLPNASAAL